MAETSSPPPPPPSEEQPEPKRQKMSTTTSDEENPETAAVIPKTPRYKRRKVAIFFAYCGVGYQGMQKNPGAKTIEGDFEEALYFAGAIPEAERGMPRRFDWARSARTDKGVSAVGQVVSGKFYVDPPGFVERLNSHLSPQIRVFGYMRATASFNAKKFCDRRRYVYLIPVFALDPSCHRDRESVMASIGSGDELVKCVECSEKGRKVPGIMGKRGSESRNGDNSVEIGFGISSNNGTGLVEKDNGTEELEHGKEVSVEGKIVEKSSEKGNGDDAKEVSVEDKIVENSLEKRNGDDVKEGSIEDMIVENSSEKGNGVDVKEVSIEDKIAESSSEKGNGDDDDTRANTISETKELRESGDEKVETTKEDESGIVEKSGFCYGEAEKERLNRILKYYEGTHNFHNFTTRTKAEDPAAKRYIISFDAKTVVNIDGIDFIKCEVVGQSFMLHQIRKMIGLVVSIMRNFCPETIMEKAFEPKVNINVPTAPEVGLHLDECFFTSYNERWKDNHGELSMKPYEDEAESFKMKYIYPHIAESEHKYGVVAVWLHSLNRRNYPDLCGVDTALIPDGNRDEVVENCPKNDEKMKMDE